MYISMGRHTDALNNFDRTLKSDPEDTTVMQMTGVCLVGEARFGEAVGMFDRALKVSPEHIVWFHREVAYMLWMNLDNSVVTYYPDRLLNPRVSEELSQQNSWKHLVGEGYLPIASTKLAKSLKAKAKHRDQNQVGDVSGSFVMSADASAVLNHTLYLAKWIQLTSPGFLPNLRQHRMFGITALHLAQLLRFNCRLKLTYPDSEAHGMVMPNAVSSDRRFPNDYFYLKSEPNFISKYGVVEDGASTVLASTIDGTYYDTKLTSAEHKVPAHYHRFNWRDFADVAVRWRQLSEPRDLVLWIDRLPLAQVGGKLGLSTHLLSGVFKNHRYYPYHDMGVKVLSRVIGERGYIFSMEHNDRVVHLSKKQVEQAKRATSVEELYKAVGGYNMSILCPCNSIQYPGLVLNGTRLIAQKGEKEGWELTISTPSSTDRYVHFESELDFVMNKLVNPALMEFMSIVDEIELLLSKNERGSEDAALLTELETRREAKKYEVIRGGLIFFFYWVHFAPLSRGTSATGYAYMVAHILAVGEHIVDSVPAKKQLDFEGMFREDPYEFVDAVYPWLSNRMQTTIPAGYLDNRKGYRLSDIFNTSRSMMSIFTAQPGEEAYNKQYTF